VKFLIFDGRSGLYWKAHSQGYGRLWQAGVYSRAVAEQIASNRDPHRDDRAVPLADRREELEAIQCGINKLLGEQ